MKEFKLGPSFGDTFTSKVNLDDETYNVQISGSGNIVRTTRDGVNNIVQTTRNGTSQLSINGLEITGASSGMTISSMSGNRMTATIGNVTVTNCDISGLKGSIDIKELKAYCDK